MKMGDESPVITKRRPGGPLVERPCFDGGSWRYFDERIVNSDEMFADWFWAKNKKPGMRDIMEGVIESAVTEGRFTSFVDSTGITDDDRAKLSAYRVLAREMGYEIGRYKFNARSHNVSAEIRRMEK